MLDNLPVQTAQVYDYLSKGNFLCSNTSVKELKTLFLIVEENFELLRDYFMYINFVLEQGNNYFYFSRKEPRATLEQKLQRFYAWIDIMDFFCTYDTINEERGFKGQGRRESCPFPPFFLFLI